MSKLKLYLTRAWGGIRYFYYAVLGRVRPLTTREIGNQFFAYGDMREGLPKKPLTPLQRRMQSGG